MKTKKLAGAAAVGAVTAVTTLLLGATPAFAQDDDSTGDSAFALSASGLIDINPLSSVKSTDGALVNDELLSIGDVAGEYEDDLAVGVLTAEAESNRSETAVTEVNLLGILKADLIRTWCDNGEGGLQIVNGTVLGQKLPETAVPGKTLDLSPLVKLALNDQTRNTDGSLSVSGIELTVLPAAEAADPDEQLSESEKAALPILGSLVGKDLALTDTVGGLVGELGGTLGVEGDVQKITIGNANCQEGAASGDNENAGDDGDDNNGSSNDDDGDDNGSSNDGGGDDDGDSGAGNDSDVKADTAPAPSVVKAALPVTG